MIVRYWRGLARSDAADEYVEHLHASTLPSLARLDGHRGAYVLRRAVAEGVEFVVLTLWDSLESIRAFAGDDYERAVVPPQARMSLATYDERAAHYEVVERRAPSNPDGCSSTTDNPIRPRWGER
jgi:heme-degrading monooxygenase HmoA